jgi:hypothetical protein
MESNKYTELVLLELIAKSSSFLEEYCKKYPSQDVNVRLFNADTKCSCKTDLILFYRDNKNEINRTISEFISNNPSEISLIGIIQSIESKYVGGRVVRIDSSDEAFSNFINKINTEGWLFRSVSTLKEDNSLIFLFF